MALLEHVARLEGQGLFVWSAADGLQRRDNPQAAMPGSYSFAAAQKGPYGKGPIADTLHISGALKHIHATNFNGIYVLVDVHPYLEDPVHQRLLKSVAQDYEHNPRTLVLIGPKITLPDDLQRLSARFELKLPDANAMRELIAQESKNAIGFGVSVPGALTKSFLSICPMRQRARKFSACISRAANSMRRNSISPNSRRRRMDFPALKSNRRSCRVSTKRTPPAGR